MCKNKHDAVHTLCTPVWNLQCSAAEVDYQTIYTAVLLTCNITPLSLISVAVRPTTSETHTHIVSSLGVLIYVYICKIYMVSSAGLNHRRLCCLLVARGPICRRHIYSVGGHTYYTYIHTYDDAYDRAQSCAAARCLLRVLGVTWNKGLCRMYILYIHSSPFGLRSALYTYSLYTAGTCCCVAARYFSKLPHVAQCTGILGTLCTAPTPRAKPHCRNGGKGHGAAHTCMHAA